MQVFLSVVLGLSSAAPQGFPQESHTLQAARNEFIREYNRLAALAAAAPDIHIIMASNRIDHPVHQHTFTQQQQVAPVHQVIPAFNEYGFTANLGRNNIFVPQAHTFPAAPTHRQAGHLAGHHFVPQDISATNARWTGPLADTVPAGVNGLPQQVRDTPEVAAAKAAHYAALNAAYHAAPRQQTHF